MKTFLENVILLAFCLIGASSCAAPQDEAKEVVDIIYKVNNYWQEQNPKHGRSFWDNAAYHTGNMEAFFLTGDTAFMDYSKAWAEHNEWKGAKSDNKAEWKYSYGESNEYVLFGDYQICFQTYADLYNIESIGPPPIIVLIRTHLIFHHFAGTRYILSIRLYVI